MLTTAVRFIEHSAGPPPPASMPGHRSCSGLAALDIPRLSPPASSAGNDDGDRQAGNAQPGELRGWGGYTATRATLSRLMPGQSSVNRPNLIDWAQTFVDCWCSQPPEPLEDFTDLDAFADGARCRIPLMLSPDSIARNLPTARSGSCNRGAATIFFTAGIGRICLINSGGSHHFATPATSAGAARQPVDSKGCWGYQTTCRRHRPHRGIWAVCHHHDPLLWDELFESMRALRATWYAGDLPRPPARAGAAAARADRRSMTVWRPASGRGQSGEVAVAMASGLSGRAIRPVATAQPAPWAAALQGTSPCWTAQVRRSCPPAPGSRYQKLKYEQSNRKKIDHDSHSQLRHNSVDVAARCDAMLFAAP